MNALCKFQLGKQGLTDNFILNIEKAFQTHKNVKINVLKSSIEEGKKGKTQVKEYADKILSRLGPNYTARAVGFVISIKKWRKARS